MVSISVTDTMIVGNIVRPNGVSYTEKIGAVLHIYIIFNMEGNRQRVEKFDVRDLYTHFFPFPKRISLSVGMIMAIMTILW